MEQLNTTKSARRRGGFGKFFAILLVVLIIGFSLFSYFHYYYTYSDGLRFGLLQKFSRKGNLFKTYEGEMILSSVKGNATVPIASEKFLFSVSNEQVAQQLMVLQGHSVTVQYKQKNSSAFWRGDSEYIVDSVRVE